MFPRIIRTAFYTSLITYLALLLGEYVTPGLASYVFSVHWLLLLTVALGIIYGWRAGLSTIDSVKPSYRWYYLLALMIGVTLSVIIWREGAMFGDFRLPLTISVFCLPLWIVYSVK